MNRRSPRDDAVATALASQIDCNTFIGSASDGVVATSASAAAFSATGASTASFGDATCAFWKAFLNGFLGDVDGVGLVSGFGARCDSWRRYCG